MHRILIVHADESVRLAIERALRQSRQALVVQGAASLADGLRRARDLDPHLVFVDVGVDKGVIASVGGELRSPGRLLVGLYNPLLLRGDWAMLRDLTRAGIGDFVEVPPSDEEVIGALAALTSRDQHSPAEGKVIAFYSHQGGVGTTSLAVNVGVLLAASQGGGSVVLCDAAVHFGAAAAYLGLNPVRDLSAFVRDPRGGAALTACLTDEPGTGLSLLAAPREPLDGASVTPEDITRLLVDLRRRFKWVIVDTAPSLDLLNLAVLDSADRVMVVTDAVTPTVVGTSALVRLLEREGFGPERISLIVSKFSSFDGNLTERTLRERLGRGVNHLVPYDRNFVIAATKGRPMAGGRMASAVQIALSSIVDDILATTAVGAVAAR